jgi:D-3-phosphoglycerate dehydrogenase
MTVSFPKNKINILLLEGVHADAVNSFKKEGYNVTYSPDSLTEDELVEKIKGFHVVGIRSKTKITQRVVEASDKLLAVGAFCIGTKQIDTDACKLKGIAVFNAPYSNTRSVVELAIGEIIMLMRSTFVRSAELHKSIWKKTAVGSREVRGKVLGIIGYGNIGKQLSVLAEAMGMKVIFFDQLEKLALGNAEKRDSMDDVFAESDVVSLHVDDSPENRNLIGENEFSKMKDGVIFINLARGFVVDIPALVQAQNSGKVAGAAVDVYPVEPKSNDEPFESELSGQPNTILTPHIGGSTMEAQKHIGNFVPTNIINYINTGSCFDAVNFPKVKVAPQRDSHRFLLIHDNISGVMAEVNNILAKYEMNITGQSLKTDEHVGYLITDVNTSYNEHILDELRGINGKIKFRLLF